MHLRKEKKAEAGRKGEVRKEKEKREGKDAREPPTVKNISK